MRRGYLELLRPATVVTALADVLAGYAVAGRGSPGALPGLLVATACLYAGGIVLNDVFDRRIDAVERPERPIPSGRVSAGGAAGLGGALVVSGVLAASFEHPPLPHATTPSLCEPIAGMLAGRKTTLRASAGISSFIAG